VIAARKVITAFRLSTDTLLSAIIASCFYFYYRNVGNAWTFEPFSFYHGVVYLDIMFVLSFTVIVLFTAQIIKDHVRKKLPKGVSKLVEDNPWNPTKTDLFNRRPAARRISRFILESHSSKSFAIGVCADWGDGKSSFLRMIKDEFPDDKNNIVIEFNPWYSQNPEKIIKDFFELFQNRLGPYKLNLSGKISRYSDSLSSVKENLFVSSIKDISNIYNGSNTIDDEHNQINEILIQLNKRIVIFIDDLDRLDKKEVVEVLKLIRNTANFFNVFFIVAFDREYVKSAIREINEHNIEIYLEKIFQLEINPPAFDKTVLKQELERLLLERFPKHEVAIKDAIYGNAKPSDIFASMFTNKVYDFNLIDLFIKNLRDVVRFVNLFTANFSQVEGEVVFKEFFYVQLIQLKYVNAYQMILKNESEYFRLQSLKSGPEYGLVENGRQL
jgi:predicted KAP-like P-loop ATPase